MNTRIAYALSAWAVGGLLALGTGCNGAPVDDLLDDSGNGGSGNDEGGSAAVSAFLPDDITLDISELPTEDDSDDASRQQALQTQSTNDYSGARRTVVAAAAIVDAFHRLAFHSLALGRAVSEDMDDPNQVQVEGSFESREHVVQYKVDFSAFDIDGDGEVDGSGNAVDVPVAVRMWVDRGEGFERFLCALITQKPSEENLGSGQMFAHPAAANVDAEEDLQFKVIWDRTDEAHKWNEIYLSGGVSEFYALSSGVQRVDVRTYEDEHVEKTIRSNSQISQSPMGFDSYQMSAHFSRGSGLALLSALSSGGLLEVNFDQVCVNLAEQELAEDGECDGFELQDASFLDAPAGGEETFPAAFEESPTF